ncbi:MAG: hypothetical protein M1358_02025, partial [Chloroflexi bacterium]|nr:hypothetical protein [Chloroflexota bacterium]
MKTRPLTTFTFVMILVLVPLLPLFEATPVAAQELQPPIHSPQEPPLPPGVGKHKKLDRSYHVLGSQMGVPGGAPGSSTRSVLPLTTGGPDSFGYRWNDAIAASWVMGATDSGLTGDDAYSSPLGIGFTFNFYGRNYTQLYAGTNGFMTFGQGATDYWNQAIPNPWSPNNFIAPFWDDLDVGTLNSGKVYTKQGVDAYGKYFVVEWRDVSTLLSPSDTLTFEVVLHENGNIALQYQSLSGDLASATVGIEDDTGTDGLLYLYSALGLSNGKAVTFTRPAASARAKVSPAYQGNFISAGAAQPFKVQVSNTGDLGADTYDLSAASTWAVSFFAADGVAPLTDTNGNGVVDTGSMAQGAIVTVTVKVQASTTAGVGASNSATITARSSKNAAKSSTANLRTAVPAPFAQVYRDDADGAMSLYLVQPSGQSLKKTTANGYAANGDQTAVA